MKEVRFLLVRITESNYMFDYKTNENVELMGKEFPAYEYSGSSGWITTVALTPFGPLYMSGMESTDRQGHSVLCDNGKLSFEELTIPGQKEENKTVIEQEFEAKSHIHSLKQLLGADLKSFELRAEF